MSFLPQFPVKGTILSNNVALDRFSLVQNTVGNSSFPAGQYVFYSKNQSIWYKYKTPTQNWSLETLFVSGAGASNVDFDKNGYPVAGYVDLNGAIKLQRFINGVPSTLSIAVTGFLPTVVATQNDVYMFWVPANYTNFFYYVQDCDNFSHIHQYSASVPGLIESMQIKMLKDGRFLFSFECDSGNTKKVYIAFTNPAYQFVTQDLKAFVTFYETTMLNDYLIIAEANQDNQLNLSVESIQKSPDEFVVEDTNESFDLKLIKNSVGLLPEYFVVAQESDLRTVQEVIFAYFPNSEQLNIKDEVPTTVLTILQSKSGGLNDYFVVSDLGYADNVNFSVFTMPGDNIYLNVAENTDENTHILTSIAGNQGNTNVILNVAEFTPTFLASAIPAPLHLNRNRLDSEYIVLSDALNYQFTQTVFILDVKFSPEHFYMADSGINFSLIKTVDILDSKFKDGFEINDTNGVSFTSDIIIFLNDFRHLYIQDLEDAAHALNVNANSFKIKESLQVEDALSILYTGYADISQHLLEPSLSVAFSDATANSLINIQKYKQKEGFTVADSAISSNIANPTISIQVLKNSGSFIFDYVASELMTVAKLFSFGTRTTKALYYDKGSVLVPRNSPKNYNIGISEPTIFYNKTSI